MGPFPNHSSFPFPNHRLLGDHHVLPSVHFDFLLCMLSFFDGAFPPLALPGSCFGTLNFLTLFHTSPSNLTCLCGFESIQTHQLCVFLRPRPLQATAQSYIRSVSTPSALFDLQVERLATGTPMTTPLSLNHFVLRKQVRLHVASRATSHGYGVSFVFVMTVSIKASSRAVHPSESQKYTAQICSHPLQLSEFWAFFLSFSRRFPTSCRPLEPLLL